MYVVYKGDNISFHLPLNIAVNLSYGGDDEDAVCMMKESDRSDRAPATRAVSLSLFRYGWCDG